MPDDIKVKLTRMLRSYTYKNFSVLDDMQFFNKIVNRVNNLRGRSIYLLKLDDSGEFWDIEYVLLESRFEIAIRSLDSDEFIEFVAEIVDDDMLTIEQANSLMREANIHVRFKCCSNPQKVMVEVQPTGCEVKMGDDANPNLQTVINRMNESVNKEDYSATLHNSAIALEIISKEVIGSAKIENQTLGSYIQKYMKESSLPEEVVNWILEIYNKRNVEPLAAHGQTKTPKISGEEAVLIAEMTKAFIRYEKWSSRLKTNI